MTGRSEAGPCYGPACDHVSHAQPAAVLEWGIAADMLELARRALEGWRHARGGSAAERRAARLLAFAFGRLDALAVLEQAPSREASAAVLGVEQAITRGWQQPEGGGLLEQRPAEFLPTQAVRPG